LEETLIIDGQAFDLSANRYPGVVHPQGFRHLKQFRLDPFPVFTYEIEGIEIEKSVFMIHGENSTVIHYELKKNNHPESPKNLQLEVRALIAFRDYHSTTHENGAINPAVEERPGLASVTPYQGLPSLHLAHNAAELKRTAHWYRNFEYDAERERGLDFSEDLFNPLALRFDFRIRRQASIIASTEERNVAKVVEHRQSEITRRRDARVSCPVEDDFAPALAAAADQYIVSRGDQKTVIAGYHWFSDWGRDTMIALPGLTLPTRKHDVARSILRTFARHVDQGMLPNRFPDAGRRPNTTPWMRRCGSSKQPVPTSRTPAIWSSSATNSTRYSRTSSPGTPAAPATESKWTPAACFRQASKECSLPGWTPRLATGS
jgi:predicted glycogen debranching enzyme